MSRPRQVIRTIKKHIALPEDLVGRLELELFSEVEGKIPMGAHQKFFTNLLRGYFETLDRTQKALSLETTS